MTDNRDERREFIAEMADETRTERELYCLTQITTNPDPLHLLAASHDWDDFTDEPARILADALQAEDDADQGDYARAREAASLYLDETVSEFAPLDEFALKDIEAALGMEAEHTGGGIMCLNFYKPGEDAEKYLCFGWANGGLGFCVMDDGEVKESGELPSGATSDAQVRFIRVTCERLGYECPPRPCLCGHSELDHVGAASAGGACWNGARQGNRCACLDYIPEDIAPTPAPKPKKAALPPLSMKARARAILREVAKDSCSAAHRGPCFHTRAIELLEEGF